MNSATTRSMSPLLQLARWSLLAGLSAFFLVALMLIARRFAAQGIRHLDPLGIVLLVAVCASLAMLIRARWSRELTEGSTSAERWAIWLLPSACLLLLGFSVTVPGASLVAVVLAWIMILAEEGFLLWRSRERPVAFARSLLRRRTSGNNVSSTVATAEPHRTVQELPPEATQSLVRTRTAEGVEAVTGTLRAQFQPGERTVYAHVGFCPPLPVTPHVEFEQTAGPEAQIKLAQALPHGARFDVRLRRASRAACVVELAFHATAGR